MGNSNPTPPTDASQSSKIYTREEVANHNTDKDCWVIFKGKVLDVTQFLEEHPGGPEEILPYAGKEIDVPFTEKGHSKEALEDTEKYVIGRIAE